MALQSGKMKSSKSKPSLWTLLMKKPGNGSGDGHVIGSHSVYDRRHHILQLQLISPLLFDTLYSDCRMNYWFQEVKFVESLKITENDFNSKLAEQAWKEAYLFVEIYNDYLPVASDILWDTVKHTADKHDSLNTILSELSVLNWFEDICRSYRNSYKPSIPNQVATALLISIYHYHTSESEDTDAVQTFDKMCDANLETCRNYHSKGNDYFTGESYELALKHYSYGLKLHPFHEVLYSNRSQTYMKLHKFKEAEFDARRAVCLKCDRPKSYYRLIESVEKQGNHLQALELAMESLELCPNAVGIIDRQAADRQAIKDLISLLRTKLNLSSGDSTELSKMTATDASQPPVDQRLTAEIVLVARSKETLDSNALPELLSTDSEAENFPSFITGTNMTTKPKKPKKFRPRTSDAATSTPDLPCKPQDTTKTISFPVAIQRQRSESETHVSLVEFKANVTDASVALLAQQCRQASYFYSKALKDLSYVDGQLSEKEIVLIKYASAFAFSNSGVYTDMMKALTLFEEIIKHHKKITFPLTFYGMACCYHKQNRFKEALSAVHKCLEAIELKPLDGTLTWPETSVVIEENEGLKIALKKLEETCKNPPRPDALCRFDRGDHIKPEIYLSDPDFKGYIKVTCLERCMLQFHPNCWKSLKEELHQTNDKEFLGKECLTPDCESFIVEIGHIGSDGDVTKKFLHHSENLARTGTKQKRSKLEKKLQAKKQKKVQKTTIEPVVDHDADSLVDDTTEAGIEKESEVTLLDKEKGTHAPAQNKENDIPAGQIPVNVPCKHSRIPSYNEDTSKVPVAMGKAVILKKDEEEIIKSKAPGHRSERHRKKDKRKQVLTIDEFLGTHNEVAFVNRYVQRLSKLNEHRNRVEEGKSICISPSTFLKLDEDEPFNVPDHLRQDYEEVRRMVSSAREEESATTRAIKENFISYMKDFMKGTGPLHLEDPRLMEEMANLPIELQELICNAGGFKEFIVKSQQFIVLQNRIYCLDSTPRLMDVANQFYDENFMLDEHNASSSEPVSSVNIKPRKGKVDSLDSFDVEPLSCDKKELSLCGTIKHESSSESEVSDSDLVYDESDEKTDDSSDISKDHENLAGQHITCEQDSSNREEEEEDDDDEEMSEYSDDEMEECMGYESDHCDKNRTVIEAKHDDSIESDISTDGQYTVRNVKDESLKNSVHLEIPAVDNAITANNEGLVHAARSGSLDSTSSSSCDISVSGERPNAMELSLRRHLDKFLQFVPRFSEKGQSQVLCLLLRIIQNEDILQRHMKDTTGFRIDALENTIRNLTLVAGVLNPVSQKAVQTMPDEIEPKLQMENKQYQEEVQDLLQKVQQLELSNQFIDVMKQEHAVALQQLNQDLASCRDEVVSTQEQLEAVTKHKSTADKKLEEMQMSLDKLKSDLDAERKLRIQAHDLSRRLQSELTTAKAMSSAQERLNASVNPTPVKVEQRNGATSPASLMSLKVHPPASIPLSANIVPQTVPWSSLPLPTPPSYLPMPLSSSMVGHPLFSVIPNLSVSSVPAPVKVPLVPRNGSSSRTANHNTIETAATKSVSSPIPTIKQPSTSSHIALDDFDDGTQAPAASSKPSVASVPGKTCKLSNSEPEMKHAPPPAQPHTSTHVHPASAASSAKTSFEKLLGILQPRFPSLSRGDLRNMVHQLRARRNNTLTGLTMEQIVTELTKIMDKQKQGAIPKSAISKAPFSSTSMGLDRIAEPGVAWQRVPSEKRQWEVNQTEEDPCIICHEEMIGKDICQLQCLHRFHPYCIRQWFREQSTCPTCRVHSILPDEFPPLA